MRKLLLLSALLIFACSSDDSNDSNQTFLEKYNGILWQPTSDFSSEFVNTFYFLNQDCFWYNYNNCDCSNYQSEENFTIITNHNNEFTIRYKLELGESADSPLVEVFYTYYYSVSDDESVMQVVLDRPVGTDLDYEVIVIGIYNRSNSPNQCL